MNVRATRVGKVNVEPSRIDLSVTVPQGTPGSCVRQVGPLFSVSPRGTPAFSVRQGRPSYLGEIFHHS